MPSTPRYVAGDNPGMGKIAAQYLIQKLGGKGNIVVLRGLPTVIDNQRFDTFMGLVKDTQIKVLDSKYANWNRDDGFKVMQDFLTRFPHIDAVWAQDDDIALGVLDAMRQAKRDKEMWVVGGGGRPKTSPPSRSARAGLGVWQRFATKWAIVFTNSSQ